MLNNNHPQVKGSLSISDRAAQLLSGIQDSLPLFKRRNAVYKKVTDISNHRLKLVLIEEVYAKCSQCRELVWFTGLSCQQCKLMSHSKCSQSIRATCIETNELSGKIFPTVQSHQFESNYFKTPTYCDHCGTLLKGIFEDQGQECKMCAMSVHHECKRLVCSPCDLQDLTASYADSDRIAPPSHQFESHYFKTPTCCVHCGALLMGLIKQQGQKCKRCKISVHHNCRQLVRFPCLDVDLTREKIRQTLHVHSHESRISIKDFDIVRVLGKGSFSKVYLAKFNRIRNTSTDEKLFAIKVIKKTNIVLVSDPRSAQTEMETLRLGSLLSSPPFLATAHCCFQSTDRLFLVMDYIEGKDLLYHVEKSRKFTEDRSRFYAAEIVLALNFLHNCGVIYRDLKLENIILDKQGHCKLFDFGMSKLVGDSKRTRTFCGTPGYIAPEIIREQDYDHSVDWWSLGVLIYEMLIGFSPFDAQDEDEIYRLILNEPVKYPPYGMLSEQARSLLDGLLEKNAHQRLGHNHSLAILEHPFFMFLLDESGPAHRWADIEAKEIEPPYLPSNDVEEYQSAEQVSLTPVDKDELRVVSQNDFEGFSFYSDSFKFLTDMDI